ncbi:hypothetical protein [Weissella soli]|jgi:hypothetical protein|uniref:Uncharacterized protein n=1 Tax=Weissella soli TaxID=155866 RepID=A0A288Q766_9LACO|nr:hypothetical protein [Weissella soli]AOT57067.1 hypothetical protein WSWS_01484 [Weissella soli]MCT8395721.1 hypothetical protein [Weissella soli]NKY83961.1 hypothetical protein [Weissella soli]RDL01077.1 hypothetical protein DFP99_1548 [Weissella soli]GEN93876.1 hypothetical protein WSO01_14880 [Weissella soli]
MAVDERFYRFDRDFDVMRYIIRLIEKQNPIYERNDPIKKQQLIRYQETKVSEKMAEIRAMRFFDAGDLFISAKVLPDRVKPKGEEYRVVLALPAKRKFAKKLADLGVEVTYRDFQGDDVIYWSVKEAYKATHPDAE